MIKRCFVISPIGETGSAIRNHADDVFRFIIEPAMRDFGIDAVRSDHMPESGRITRQMFREIFESDLCAVVLTGANPNVYYELAVAQCVARPCIVLIEAGQPLPFDVKDLRTIHYSLEPIGPLVDGRYAEEVKAQIASIEARGWIAPSLFSQVDLYPQLKTDQQFRRLVDGARPETSPPGHDCSYQVPTDPLRRISLDTGDILAMDDLLAEVIVSPETTDLQLGRFCDPTISGKLRYLDAQRSRGGRIVEDHLAQSLHREIEKQEIILPLVPGSVVSTPTNGLSRRGVKRVFHVAALNGVPGSGYAMPDDVVDDSVRNAFDTFEELAQSDGLRSILFPMFGAYTSNLVLVEVAQRVVRAVVSKMAVTPACQTVHLLAWNEAQRFAFRKACEELDLQAVDEQSVVDTQAGEP